MNHNFKAPIIMVCIRLQVSCVRRLFRVAASLWPCSSGTMADGSNNTSARAECYRQGLHKKQKVSSLSDTEVSQFHGNTQMCWEILDKQFWYE